MSQQFPILKSLLTEEEDDISTRAIRDFIGDIWRNWDWDKKTNDTRKKFEASLAELEPKQVSKINSEMSIIFNKLVKDATSYATVGAFVPSSKKEANATLGNISLLSKQAAQTAIDFLNQANTKFRNSLSEYDFAQLQKISRSALNGKLMSTIANDAISKHFSEVSKSVKYTTTPAIMLNETAIISNLISAVGKKPDNEKKVFIEGAVFILLNMSIRLHLAYEDFSRRIKKMSFPE